MGAGCSARTTTSRWSSSPGRATWATRSRAPPSRGRRRSASASSCARSGRSMVRCRVAADLRRRRHGRDVALPGDQSAARTEQRQRQLDQLGERSHGPGRDHVVATAMASIVGHGLGTVGDDLERRAVETPGRSGAERGITGDLQEARLLGHRVDQRQTAGGQRQAEGQARIARRRCRGRGGPADGRGRLPR